MKNNYVFVISFFGVMFDPPVFWWKKFVLLFGRWWMLWPSSGTRTWPGRRTRPTANSAPPPHWLFNQKISTYSVISIWIIFCILSLCYDSYVMYILLHLIHSIDGFLFHKIINSGCCLCHFKYIRRIEYGVF